MPTPPILATVPQPATAVILVVIATLVCIGLASSVTLAIARRQPVALLIIVGGALGVLWEPIVDILGACWHPMIGQWTAFITFDRGMPVWICFAYAWYFGVQPALLWYLLDSGRLRARQLWIWWMLMMGSDVVLETIGLHFNIWNYYGQQPLLILKFPWWWAPLNSCGVLGTAVAARILTERVAGFQRGLLILVPSLSYGAATAVVGMPAFIVLNSTGVPLWITHTAGLGCFVLGALWVANLVRLYEAFTLSGREATRRDLSGVKLRAPVV